MQSVVSKQKNFTSRNKSREEIEAEYEVYLKHDFKYKKSQLCYYFFKGICHNPNCQFAHGMKDLDMDAYFTFISDKTVFPSEKAENWQKPYFYRLFPRKDRTYIGLFEYQNEHKDRFEHLFTQKELIEDGMKRMVIRRELASEVLSTFVKKLFNRFNIIETNKLQKYIVDVTYFLSSRGMNKDNIYYTKVIKDKKTKKNFNILFPPNEEMMSLFVNCLIQYVDKTDTNIFPFSYNTISSIIYKLN